MHGKDLGTLTYESVSIWSENGIEKYFLAVQFISKELQEFLELVDSPNAQAEKWAERLIKLGEPLA